MVRVDTLAQLFETAQLLALQPLPAGRRVGIVGTSSALAALATDACRGAGLEVPGMPADVQVALRALAGTTETANPVDLGPLTAPEQLAVAVQLVVGSGEVDAVLALITPHPDAEGLARVLLAASLAGPLPVLASYLGVDGVPAELAVGGGQDRGSVPSYASPESAALALGRAASYAAWRARPMGEVPALVGLHPEQARQLAAPQPHDGQWLAPAAARELLAAAGIEVWPTAYPGSLAEALQAAAAYGWPVVLKSADPRWRNRADMGAVQLGLHTPDELRAAWDTVQALVGGGEVVVQPMAPPGVSTVVRLRTDPAVGPLVSLRLGGVAADLLADPLTRTLPLTDLDAADLVAGIRGAMLLQGTDTAALTDALLRVARLAEEVPDAAEVLLDPVLVGARGVVVLHGGVRLLPAELDPERGPRRLTGRGAAHLR